MNKIVSCLIWHQSLRQQRNSSQIKLLFQSLCDDGLEWDISLTGELRLKCLKLVDDLGKTKPITLPRCYFVHIKQKVVARQLYEFCDTSISAYAAVIYLVVTTARRYVAFVTAKTMVEQFLDRRKRSSCNTLVKGNASSTYRTSEIQ